MTVLMMLLHPCCRCWNILDSAVDVAKEAADIVLLEKDLGVLVEGVKEGR